MGLLIAVLGSSRSLTNSVEGYNLELLMDDGRRWRIDNEDCSTEGKGRVSLINILVLVKMECGGGDGWMKDGNCCGGQKIRGRKGRKRGT